MLYYFRHISRANRRGECEMKRAQIFARGTLARHATIRRAGS
jgi:hypothetical protein